MKTLQTTDPINLCTGNSRNGRIFKSWYIYNRNAEILHPVAKMESDKLSPEREMELANLFAAAPDLVEALQRLRACRDGAFATSEKSWAEAMVAAGHAIAKARGTVPSGS